MLVLGIDPGSLITGYAFVESSSPRIEHLKVLEYGIIRANPRSALFARLNHICGELEQRIREYAPSLLIMEESFYAKNAHTALVLGHARGAIMATAMRYCTEFAEFSPRAIKQAVTGHGAASKERVALMIQKHLRLAEKPQPADAADALAVAWTYFSPQRPHIQDSPSAFPADVTALLTRARKRHKRRLPIFKV